MCLLLVGCKKEEKKEEVIIDNTSDFVTLKNEDISVYSKVNILDLIEVKNEEIKINTENSLLDTSKLGEKSIDIVFTYLDKKYSHKFNINIKDNTPPLVFSGTDLYLTVGYEGNLCDEILYGDNYTSKVNCIVEGSYDFNTVGSYNINYILTDESNNVTTENSTIYVSYPSEGEYYPSYIEPIDFSDIYNKYKNENTEIGLDVSEWQEEIDFNKVKEEGVSFVMLRIALQGTESRKLFVDAEFKENIKKAHEAGLDVGVYFYTVAVSKEEAINQADYVLDILDGEKLELPIAFDWETWSNWNSYNISFHELDEIANAFINRVEEKGYKGMLYSSKYYLETIWENSNNNPVWLAHYTDETSYKGPYEIWQLCNNALINGINGYTDVNVLYK